MLSLRALNEPPRPKASSARRVNIPEAILKIGFRHLATVAYRAWREIKNPKPIPQSFISMVIPNFYKIIPIDVPNRISMRFSNGVIQITLMGM